MINNFYAGIRSKNPAAANDVLKEVIDYTTYHFATEDASIKRANYPAIEAHKKEHAEFIETAQGIKNKPNNGSLVLSPEVTNFLKKSSIDHVRGTDT